MLFVPDCALCGASGGSLCSTCVRRLAPAGSIAAPPELDTCWALLDYASSGRLVPALKNRGRRDLIGWLASEIGRRAPLPRGALVTWVPTSGSRRRARGFDQAELLARAVARRAALRCGPLLRRRPGPAQSGRSALLRAAHPGFVATRRCPGVVVLVDDVVATGSTLTAGARALRAGGAGSVHALVVARSPGRAHARARPEVPAYDEGCNAPDPEVTPTWTSP